jgi:hypothetical protein
MINKMLLHFLMRDAKEKPLGNVLCLGRQSVHIDAKQFIDAAGKEGFPIPDEIPSKFNDRELFKALGAESLDNLDHSDFEGANIICDLNFRLGAIAKPFDYVVDGGTFDHLFDLPAAFENVYHLLKNGGRLFQWNACNNYLGVVYMQFNPSLFSDYYRINNYKNVRCWIAESELNEVNEPFDIYQVNLQHKLYRTKNPSMVLVKAEKQDSSTWHIYPSHGNYKSESDIKEDTFKLIERL